LIHFYKRFDEGKQRENFKEMHPMSNLLSEFSEFSEFSTQCGKIVENEFGIN